MFEDRFLCRGSSNCALISTSYRCILAVCLGKCELIVCIRLLCVEPIGAACPALHALADLIECLTVALSGYRVGGNRFVKPVPYRQSGYRRVCSIAGRKKEDLINQIECHFSGANFKGRVF